MKKLLTLLTVCLLWATPALCDTTTTYYSLDQPSIGSISWGLNVNSNFATIDTDLWKASNGTTISVNAPSASSSTIVLTNPIASVQSLSFSTTGQSVQLPAANATKSPIAGGGVRITNAGSNAFGVLEADGSTVLVSSITAGQSVTLLPLSNSTTNGTWYVAGPYLSSVGTLSLGTTTTGANPAVSGNQSYGFYTPSGVDIAATINGVETWLVNSAGTSVAGNESVSKALSFTASTAAATGITGVHSTVANSLALETTGADALTVTATQSVGVGTTAPDQQLTVVGSIHSTTSGFEFPNGITVNSTSGISPTAATTTGNMASAALVATNSHGDLYAASLANSITTNGYQTLPGGIIIQWGSLSIADSSTSAVSFPLTFPNNVFSVTFGNYGNGGGTTTFWGAYQITSGPTISGFSVTSHADNTNTFSWIAVGN